MSHPTPPTTPTPGAAEPLPCDELVLAAIERAALHRARDTPAVPTWSILAHLSVARRSTAARHVHVRLDVLHAAGWVEPSRRHGVSCWELTPVGGRHLARARRRGDVPALPESPQHRAWRNARRTAAQEIERFTEALRACMTETAEALDADEMPTSDALFELADRLHRTCRRLGSAAYCLNEWREPDDGRADVEEHLDLAASGLSPAEQALRRAHRSGRRNIRLWDLNRRLDRDDAC